MKRSALFYQLFRKINPLPPVGAIAIGDTSLRFLLLRSGNKVLTASLRLPPKIVQGGKVVDEQKFKIALQKLHDQVFPSNKQIHVILSLAPELIYTQSFSLPLVEQKKLKEAADLNLRMISPFDPDSVYSDWQQMNELSSDGLKIDLLGAFVESGPVNQFLRIFEQTNFMITAVEFPALALSRLIREAELEKEQGAYLALHISEEGIAFMLLQNQSLYFHKFHSWRGVREEMGHEQISTEDLQTFLVREMQKVLNFYSGKWGGTIDSILLFSDALSRELKTSLEKQFEMPVRIMALHGFKKLSSAWYPVLGSALRGITSRSQDTMISLTNIPVQAKYYRARLLGFIGFWRKMALTVVIFTLFFFGITDLFFVQEKRRLEDQRSLQADKQEVSEIYALQDKGEEFNYITRLAIEAHAQTIDWEPVFAKIFELAAGDISYERITSQNSILVINGSANTELQVIAFKERLLNERDFENIDLPLVNIQQTQKGDVAFTVRFDVASLRIQK